MPSQSRTPISSEGPRAASTPWAQSRATWLPLLNSMPCMMSTTAPLGRTFLLSSSMLTGSVDFERRAAVAAGGVGLVAADADQADAKIAHGALEQVLRRSLPRWASPASTLLMKMAS